MSFPADTKSNPSLLPQTSTVQPLEPKPGPQLYTDVQGYPQGVLLQPVRDRRRLARRVLHGFLFIFIFCWLANATRRLVFRHHWFRGQGPDYEMHEPDSDPYYDIPSDLILEDCIQGAEWNDGSDDGPFHSAITTFEIPLSFDNIFLISRGHFSSGIVDVITSSAQAKDSITFNIVAKYQREDVFALAKACLTSRAENQQGVGIFTPTWRHGSRGRHPMHFETTVVLPEDTSPITVNGFETDVPNTLQTVRHLANKISFESLTLKGTNLPINVEAVSAIQGLVHTTNAGIRGTFNTTSSLVLQTTNSPINIAVGLHDEGRQPSLVAHTTNGHLAARISLTTPSGEGGNFSVDTSTTNVPLSVSFIDAPLDSVLQHKARTTNSRADVTLHPTYEGDFDVTTSRYFKAELNFLPADDPSGKERKRSTLYQRSRNYFSGNSKWLDPQNPEYNKTTSSSVTLFTTNSPVILNFLGI